jgi:hypothetical protein
MKKLVAILCVLMTLSSCKKEGCTDAFAVNYSSEAEKDDSSCIFEGRVVFWFTASTATDLVNASVPNVDFVVNGITEGNISMTESSVVEPGCTSGEGFLAYVDLTDSENQTLPYVIYKGGTNDIIQSGNVAVFANQCRAVELSY